DEDEIGVFVVETPRLLRVVPEIMAGNHLEVATFLQEALQLRDSVGPHFPEGFLFAGLAAGQGDAQARAHRLEAGAGTGWPGAGVADDGDTIARGGPALVGRFRAAGSGEMKAEDEKSSGLEAGGDAFEAGEG